jgi:hypothetical protein
VLAWERRAELYLRDIYIVKSNRWRIVTTGSEANTMDSSTILRSTSLVGFSSSLFLSGIYFSSSHLTLPLLYHLPTDISTSAFTTLYYSGANTVVPLAIFSSLCSGVAAYLDPPKRVGYAIAAVSTIASLPWTLVVIAKTNETLIAMSKDAHVREKAKAGEVEALLRRWTWMNMVRAGMAAVGGIVGLVVAADVMSCESNHLRLGA